MNDYPPTPRAAWLASQVAPLIWKKTEEELGQNVSHEMKMDLWVDLLELCSKIEKRVKLGIKPRPEPEPKIDTSGLPPYDEIVKPRDRARITREDAEDAIQALQKINRLHQDIENVLKGHLLDGKGLPSRRAIQAQAARVSILNREIGEITAGWV